MRYESQIRDLAKGFFYQKLYNSAKELPNLQLFDNSSNFTGFQIVFLYWLEIYNMLYKELYGKEWDNLSEAVIKDNVRCDAFLHYRHLEREKELNKSNKEAKVNKLYKGNPKGKGSAESFKIYKG